MFEAVEGLLAEHAELERRLALPETHADARSAKTLNQRYAELTAIITTWRAWQRTGGDLAAARELAAEDPTFADEVDDRSAQREAAEERLRRLLVPRDPTDDKDAILEIKSGEGGEESALFAGDLLRMYTRYAERAGWKTEILDATESDLGGYKSVTVAVKAQGHARAGPRAVRAAEVRGRRPPRPAGAGHRVAGPGPHQRGRRPGDARGRAGRRRDRRERPAHRRLPQQRPRRPERQHHRLRGPDHPPADRHRGQLPEREEPAAEQGAGAAHPAGPAAGRRPGGGRRRGERGPAQPGPHRRPLRADPHLQLPGEPHLRPPHRLQGLQPRPGARRRPAAGPRLVPRGRPRGAGSTPSSQRPGTECRARRDLLADAGATGSRAAGVESPSTTRASCSPTSSASSAVPAAARRRRAGAGRRASTTRWWRAARRASRSST